jgi:hypothetical protein
VWRRSSVRIDHTKMALKLSAHPVEDRDIERGREMRVRATAAQVSGHRRGSEQDRDDERQQLEVQERQESVRGHEALERRVVVHPR